MNGKAIVKGSKMRGENDGELVSAIIGFRNGRVFKDDKCAITFLGRALNQFLSVGQVAYLEEH